MQQQIQDPRRMNKNRHQTPYEKLLVKKAAIKEKCLLYEGRLKKDYAYIKENRGSLLKSGFWALFVESGTHKTSIPQEETGNTVSAPKETPLSGVLSIIKGLTPAASQLAVSLFFRLATNKVKAMLQSLFTHKNKREQRNKKE